MVEIWGRADNGSFARIIIEGADTVEIGEWWPFDGLELVEPHDGPSLDVREFHVDARKDGCWDRLESDLGLFTAEWLRGRVAIHSAVLVHGDVMVLVPGSSMRGKTTMCVAAMELGVEVWSDEYALVDPTTGLTSGWPRRLSVREGHGLRRRVANVKVNSHRSLAPSLVAHVFYQSDSSHAVVDLHTTIVPMSQGEVVSALLANTVCAQSRPTDAFQAATCIARNAIGLEGERADATDAVHYLFAKCGIYLNW